MRNSMKSGETCEFFKVSKAGLTVAYRKVGDQIFYGVSWRNDKDEVHSEKGRMIAMSRLNHHPMIVDNDEPGKERNQILRKIDANICKGARSGEKKQGMRLNPAAIERWNNLRNDTENFLYKLLNR